MQIICIDYERLRSNKALTMLIDFICGYWSVYRLMSDWRMFFTFFLFFSDSAARLTNTSQFVSYPAAVRSFSCQLFSTHSIFKVTNGCCRRNPKYFSSTTNHIPATSWTICSLRIWSIALASSPPALIWCSFIIAFFCAWNWTLAKRNVWKSEPILLARRTPSRRLTCTSVSFRMQTPLCEFSIPNK